MLNKETPEPDLQYPTPEHTREPLKTWRILFVDTPDNVRRLRDSCILEGYVVVSAITLDEAWAFLHGKNHADVIVCAAYLEEESMFNFLRGVRESKLHRNTMFLVLSLESNEAGARLDRSTERAAMILGADGYLVMPAFDPVALIARIRRLQPEIPTLQQAPEEEG